jgi:hypothetical protein
MLMPKFAFRFGIAMGTRPRQQQDRCCFVRSWIFHDDSGADLGQSGRHLHARGATPTPVFVRASFRGEEACRLGGSRMRPRRWITAGCLFWSLLVIDCHGATHSCDLIAQKGCSRGEKCVSASNGVEVVVRCSPIVGDLLPGDECSFDERGHDDCAPGADCTSWGIGQRADEGDGLTEAEQVRLWAEWVQEGPEGPTSDEGEPEFPSAVLLADPRHTVVHPSAGASVGGRAVGE